MQALELVRPNHELNRRIEDLQHAKSMFRDLAPSRERRFSDGLAQVRVDAASANAAVRANAWLTLELLALELCDD